MITKETIIDSLDKVDDLLLCTQERLCLPIIERICHKMQAGLSFTSIKVDGSLICDGHHRYIASLLSEHEINRIKYPTTSATKVIQWEDVEFVEEDYETSAAIEELDKKDADFNEITLEELHFLLKKERPL